MGKFFIKFLIFLFPIFVYMGIPSITKFILDEELELKINTFLPVDNDVDLIIAGDSRAERQLIPEIFINELNLNTVNIAKDVGDIMSLIYSNRKYNFADSNKIFVICVSSLIINDGSYQNWFMSQASITEIGFLKRILLFRKDYLENWYRRVGLIWEDLVFNKRFKKLPQDDMRLAHKGYYPIDETIDIDKMHEIDQNPLTTEHLWYRKPNNNGIRKKIFEESIKMFSGTGAKIILIQSPMAPIWKKISNGSYMQEMELEFGRLLLEIGQDFDNIWTIDFYTNQPKIFTNDLFYNSTHLNSTGAIVFTSAVIDSINSKGIIK